MKSLVHVPVFQKLTDLSIGIPVILVLGQFYLLLLDGSQDPFSLPILPGFATSAILIRTPVASLVARRR